MEPGMAVVPASTRHGHCPAHEVSDSPDAQVLELGLVVGLDKIVSGRIGGRCGRVVLALRRGDAGCIAPASRRSKPSGVIVAVIAVAMLPDEWQEHWQAPGKGMGGGTKEGGGRCGLGGAG